MIDTLTRTPAVLALSQGIALHQRNGLLVVSDADRSDFLHRMTTNNINALRPGQAAVTVLTSPTARVLFVFTVICRPDELWLLPAANQAAALARHLRGQIFFMDKVKVRDASTDFGRVRLLGPAAASALASLGIAQPLADDSWHEHDGLLALRQDRYDLPGVELVVEAARLPATLAVLEAAGALLLTDDEPYHARRVELGRPAPGFELTEEYSPLEAGLAWACADNKGCYTGQEIIARQITYDKVTKTLVGLRTSKPLPPGGPVTAPGGQNVGTVTSAAFSPTLGEPVALAILKRPHNVPGTALLVGDLPVEVVALPFVTN